MNLKAYNRAYYQSRRKTLLGRSLVYQATHPKQHSMTTGIWQKEHPELVAIAAAKQRCTNPNNPGYKNYGARGIQWRITYKALLAEIGQRPDGCSLDRIDNDGHYESGNIRWATRKQQNANRR